MTKYFLLAFWLSIAALLALYGPTAGQGSVTASYAAATICVVVGVASMFVRR